MDSGHRSGFAEGLLSLTTITRDEGRYRLRTDQRIPRRRDEVFAFFADATNLDRLTPPWLRFRIRTPLPVEMREGTILDYRLRIHGLPLRWRSEIEVWEPPERFVDTQRRGPYRHWRHEHRFEEADGGTRMIDEVTYVVPGGHLVHRLFVRRDVLAIFDYRREQLGAVFGDGERGPGPREEAGCASR